MAGTSVLKLLVDDREYNASLKNARQGMLALQQSLEGAGKTFSDVDGKVVEYARALGQMETVSKSAKGKIGEMSSAFIDLSAQYKAMTDQEKASPVGKALAESLDQLKTRVIDAKNDLKQFEDQLKPVNTTANESGGILSQLKDKFTINIDALKLFNVGLQGAKAALDVAKDAFLASEANVDEWGRVMKSAQGLYEGFLNALNTGDISGYLSRMNDIVKAARAAYDAMDTLQTMKTIQSPQFSKQETENNRLRTMIMTGRWISAGDGRKSPLGLKDGDLLSPDQIKTLERQLQNGMQTIVSLTKNELKQTGVAIDKYYDSLAKQNGMTMDEFRKGTSSWAEFSKRLAGAQKYNEFEREHTTYADGATFGHRDKAINPYAEYRGWDVFRVDKMGDNSYNELVGLIKQQQSQQSQMYSTIGQAYRTINRAEGVTVKGIMSGGSGSGKGGGGGKTSQDYAADSIAAQQALIQQLTKQWNEAGASVRDQYVKPLVEAEAKLKEMQNAQALAKEQAQGRLLGDTQKTTYTATVTADTQEALDKLREIDGVTIDPKTATVTADTQEALDKLREIDGIHFDEKTIKVNVERQSVQTTGIDGIDFKGFASGIPNISKGLQLDNIPQHLAPLQQLNAELARLKELLELSPNTEAYQAGLQKIADKEKEIAEFKGTSNLGKDADKSAKSFQSAASAISQVGSALNSIEDPTAKIMGIVAQAIAGVAAGAGQAVSAKDTTSSGWAWIGAAAAITASMIAMISQIHSATGYQNGGVVKGYANGGIASGIGGGMIDGTTYSSDQIPILANAGEVILNKSQQANLASQLQVGGISNMKLSATITGEQLRLVLNNNGRRTGRGEYVTTNFT